jgi:hypothetical protein
MNDYGARLAWTFNPAEDGSRVHVGTFAALPVTQLQQ